MKIFKCISIIIFSLVTLVSSGIGNEELNSIIGFKIGMSKEETILKLKELNIEYKEYPENDEINFMYDILQDTKEMNMVKLFFKDVRLSQINVYFYKYNMLIPIQNTKRFQKYLDELDKIYDNDINWKGKWKNKDGSLIIKTYVEVMLDNAYDVLIIQENFKK